MNSRRFDLVRAAIAEARAASEDEPMEVEPTSKLDIAIKTLGTAMAMAVVADQYDGKEGWSVKEIDLMYDLMRNEEKAKKFQSMKGTTRDKWLRHEIVFHRKW